MDIEIKRMIFLSKNKKLVLKLLSKGPKMIYELEKETKLLLPNLSRTIKGLEKIELIYQTNPEFRKGKIFDLTDKGKRYTKELVNEGLL